MAGLRAWWRWRRAVRQGWRERDAAYLRWMRARHEYRDTIEVVGYFKADEAGQRERDAFEAFIRARDGLCRLEECGP